jgi:nickel-dependent lactate racemase
MGNYHIPYGMSQIEFNIPDGVQTDWIAPPDPQPHAHPEDCVRSALEEPVGEFLWEDLRNIHSAVIAVNDKTRPVPHEYLLPPLLHKLEAIGLPPGAIHLLVASGTHVPMRSDEFSRILPQTIIERYPVTSHDCDSQADLVSLGTTAQGTPVWANRHLMEADLRIVVGDIEPHHFMGYSGGVKSAAIGLAGRQTININHAMLTDPHAFTAHYTDNPMRMDVEEIGRMMGIHLAVNAILTHAKEIVQVVAGSPLEVMQVGIPLVKKWCQVAVAEKYPLVIASAGGHPKDINFYQSQKALTHAALLTQPGGTILLIAACPEGLGSQAYAEWIEGMRSHSQVIERFSNEGFRIGPHKAFQVARIAQNAAILIFSQMPEATVRQILLQPVADLQTEIDRLLANQTGPARVAVLPFAVGTVPDFSSNLTSPNP